MKQPSPLISVIIPTFNRAPFLPEALASVQAQNFCALQVIVVDDGSTDNTATVVRDFGDKLEYIYQSNRGPAAARNRGLACARGQWIAFLDSDDVWAAGRLHRQLTLAEAYPTAQVIWGMLQIAQQTATNLASFAPSGLPTLQTSFDTALIQRALFAMPQIGTLNEALWSGEDADWFCRLFEQNVEIVVHQEVVAFYRWHQTNLVANQAANKEKARQGLLHALARSLQRRRQQGGNTKAERFQPNIHWVTQDLRIAKESQSDDQ